MKFNFGGSIAELLSVTGIVCLLFSVGAFFFYDCINTADYKVCNHNIRVLEKAESEYYLTYGNHTTEYLSCGLIDKNSDLFTNNILYENHCDSTHKYCWVNTNSQKALLCLTCSNCKVKEIKELLSTYKRNYLNKDTSALELLNEYDKIKAYFASLGYK